MAAGATGRATGTGRPSSVECLSPPVLCSKRTRPASACARSGRGHNATDGASSESGSVHQITDVLVDWQLESPPKRPTLLHSSWANRSGATAEVEVASGS